MSVRRTIADIQANFNNPNDQVNELYKRLEDQGYDWGSPDVGEFNSVLNTFSGWVASETKKVTGPDDPISPKRRAEIINHIKASVAANMSNCVFSGIDPAVFGIQLAMRVRRPRSISQGQTGLCGPVSVLYTFAKTQPMPFAQFAIDLLFKGKALFGDLEIEPSPKIRQGFLLRDSVLRWAVDYVTLVSLRQCTFFSDSIGIDALRGADETSLPGQIGTWLRQAGYSNVSDHTFFGKNQQKVVKAFAGQIGQPTHLFGAVGDAAAKVDRTRHAKQSLTVASQEIANGRLVILFSDRKIGDSLQDGTNRSLKEHSGPTKIGHHHWMAVRKLEVFGDTIVKLKVITWGKSYQGTFDFDAFVSRYNGFISADP